MAKGMEEWTRRTDWRTRVAREREKARESGEGGREVVRREIEGT
jgi:hypothetical protein